MCPYVFSVLECSKEDKVSAITKLIFCWGGRGMIDTNHVCAQMHVPHRIAFHSNHSYAGNKPREWGRGVCVLSVCGCYNVASGKTIFRGGEISTETRILRWRQSSKEGLGGVQWGQRRPLVQRSEEGSGNAMSQDRGRTLWLHSSESGREGEGLTRGGQGQNTKSLLGP